MLDEAEFAEIAHLYSAAFQNVKRFREESGANLKHPTVDELFRPVSERYAQLTGFKESNANAIMHHRFRSMARPAKDAASHCGHQKQRFVAVACCRWIKVKTRSDGSLLPRCNITDMAIYRVAVRKSEEGYSVSCPGLPGCWSQGATEEDALNNIRVAIREYVEAAEELARNDDSRVVEVAVA